MHRDHCQGPQQSNCLPLPSTRHSRWAQGTDRFWSIWASAWLVFWWSLSVSWRQGQDILLENPASSSVAGQLQKVLKDAYEQSENMQRCYNMKLGYVLPFENWPRVSRSSQPWHSLKVCLCLMWLRISRRQQRPHGRMLGLSGACSHSFDMGVWLTPSASSTAIDG